MNWELVIEFIKNTKLQHQQIFFEDEKGGDIGFFNDGLHADNPKNLNLYQDTDGKHYDDDIMRKAVENVKQTFSPKYNLFLNNCQDFTSSVIREYQKILDKNKFEPIQNYINGV
ncbi:hypothetical protein [Helicobacter sp. 11S02596-1]|uniref:hypothetical protein n=1 Tax=Helicobacter sp. 11S02596-1 TaxID=1476194 RepID=UPI000BA776E6|nr:hypothetical protein [Helicobacter sp. 11S02596-1]PAF44758.1 hypothetical protein BJI48_01865 [Helicobacter sp. 11S02596-1]